MDLKQFTAKQVSPGEPITAQAWNELVSGLKELNDFVLASQSTSMKVKLGNADIDTDSVRVTARRDDGWMVEAAAPVNGEEHYVFGSLPPGAFTLIAEAPGFKTGSASVTIPSDEVISITLVPDGAFMPNLLGVELAAALSELNDRSITVGRLLDVVGRELPPANPDAEYTGQPVLVQLPAPGVAVPPDGAAQLVVSAALQVDDSVEIPPLTGLTLSEARKALDAIGLKLGRVETRSKNS